MNNTSCEIVCSPEPCNSIFIELEPASNEFLRAKLTVKLTQTTNSTSIWAKLSQQPPFLEIGGEFNSSFDFEELERAK